MTAPDARRIVIDDHPRDSGAILVCLFRAQRGLYELDEARVRWTADDELPKLRRIVAEAVETIARNVGTTSWADRIAVNTFAALPMARIRQVIAQGTGAEEIA